MDFREQNEIDAILQDSDRGNQARYSPLRELDELGPEAAFGVRYWMASFLGYSPSPGADLSVRIGEHWRADVLRWRHTQAHLRISVYQTSTLLLVRIDKTDLDLLSLPDEQARREAVSRAAKNLLRTDLFNPPGLREVDFPEHIQEGVMFANHREPGILTERDRTAYLASIGSVTDPYAHFIAGIRGGELYLMCIKTYPIADARFSSQWVNPWLKEATRRALRR